MNLVQLVNELLTKSNGEVALALVVLLVISRCIITKIDVHCNRHISSNPFMAETVEYMAPVTRLDADHVYMSQHIKPCRALIPKARGAMQ